MFNVCYFIISNVIRPKVFAIKRKTVKNTIIRI
ncbi:hypothetical protein CoNPh11_CDS0018 [Staphylococcus phage S-CoN_Ph11]|nr:hypothetical protein CoNPh11_CDS0018 [Staphylococcus phage S-CoN_Ph11]